ncbi:MAG: polysaccharide deacetylase family protein (PEP-CTERM system associated) [Gammaproteobacteria bacterium]|jgi:polysaccharide deacetylase family protein (PEP-CTERM system associated)
MDTMKNAMTVDVEDYFQVSAFEKHISRDTWDNIPRRVETNTDLILSLFDEHQVKATFFTLGWIAERHPVMLRKISDAGHEIASHGYEHIRVTQHDRNLFRQDITRTKKLLEDITGKPVYGYRAASFSLNTENHWAHEELEMAGHHYSSSIYPIRHDLYGIPGGERFVYRPGQGSLLEIPISTVQVGKHRVPAGGGGYFRLFPYALSRFMINHINRKEKRSCIFYFHPWELDPAQPRIEGLNIKTRFRHYNNLSRMQDKLSRILDEISWGTVREIFLRESTTSESANTSDLRSVK